MGVDGLHGLVKDIGVQRTPLDLKGQTLGVDGYGWLHKAAYSCAGALMAGTPTTRLVESIDRRVRVYEAAGVKLYFVFDGAPLAAKDRVNANRAASRQAAARTNSGYAKALDITPEHAAQVIAYLRARGIPYVVAPYEADAQLVYLEQIGLVDAILSEDGDLLVFGAQRLLTKADPNGICTEIAASQFGMSQLAGMASDDADWTHLLRVFAILRGCDYAVGINGIGPKKAIQLVRRCGSIEQALVVLAKMQPIPPGFEEEAKVAELAFTYQRVWDPRDKALVTLNEPGENTVLLEQGVGAPLSPDVAARVARGAICPISYKTLVVPPIVASWVRSMRPFSVFRSDTRAERRIASFVTPSSKQTTFTTSPFFARPLKSAPTATPVRSIPTQIPTPVSLRPPAGREDTIVDSPLNQRLEGKENLPNPNLTPAPVRKRAFSSTKYEAQPVKRPSIPLAKFNFDQYKYTPPR